MHHKNKFPLLCLTKQIPLREIKTDLIAG